MKTNKRTFITPFFVITHELTNRKKKKKGKKAINTHRFFLAVCTNE